MQLIRKYFGNTSDALLFVSLIYVAVVMPFQKPEVPIWPGVAMMTVAWLFSGNLKNKIQFFFGNRNAIIFSALYLFYCFGYFYSSNTNYAQTDLLLKIPLLIFPLVITSSSLKDKTDFILKTFLIACFISAVGCIVRAGYMTYTTGENYFYYYKLSWFFHVGHYAMYLAFAAFTTLYFLFSEKGKTNFFLQAVYCSAFVFFTIVIILLSARAQIIAFGVVIVLGAINYIFKKENRLKGLTILVSTLIISVAALYLVPQTRERFMTSETEINSLYTKNNTDNYYTHLRLTIWQTGLEVIKKQPFFGAGTGDAKDELIKKAEEKKYDIIVKKNLNYHNQFLQTWAAIGLPGLLVLLLSIISGTVYAVKQKKFLPLAFFILVVVSFFTESMLERQAGVIFYSFFSAILIFAHRKENAEIL